MTLSSRVIKRVEGEMEAWPVQARNIMAALTEEEPVGVVESQDQEADLIINRARFKADQLMNDTASRISQMENEAYEKGYASGQQAATRDYQEAIEGFHANSRQVLQEINQLRQAVYTDTEQEILSLAVQIAQKLVCRQLEIDPATIADIAQAACMQAKECEMVIIYAHPDHLENLRNRKAEIQAQLYRAQKIEFIGDPGISGGGCRIETEQGHIDATIDTMIEHIRSLIKDAD